jgi:hypothetical protein
MIFGRSGVKWAVAILLCLFGLHQIYKLKYPDYVYRYRLSLTVEIDGTSHTGSSVIEVRWIGSPSIQGHGSYSSTGFVYGQAPLIDLGARGILIVSLSTGEGYGPASDGASDALWLCANAFRNDSGQAGLQRLQHETGRRQLESGNFPRLVWLSDKLNPATAVKIEPWEIEFKFGAGARIVSAFVEMTNEPITDDAAKTLPWLNSWKASFPRMRVSRPGVFQLVPRMIAGDA